MLVGGLPLHDQAVQTWPAKRFAGQVSVCDWPRLMEQFASLSIDRLAGFGLLLLRDGLLRLLRCGLLQRIMARSRSENSQPAFATQRVIAGKHSVSVFANEPRKPKRKSVAALRTN